MERLAGLKLGVEPVEQIQQTPIDLFDLIRPEVAQHVIDLRQPVRQVISLRPVDSVDFLTGVQI